MVTWGCVAPEGIYFCTPMLAKGIPLGNLVWAKACYLAILLQEKWNFGNSRIQTQNFRYIGLEMAKILAFFVKKTPIHDTFDVGFDLAKGTMFKKIGPENSIILKLQAAQPYPDLAENPLPPPVKLTRQFS